MTREGPTAPPRRSFGFPLGAPVPPSQVPFWRVVYALRARWWRVRSGRFLTRLLGPRYRRSRERIEIDVTYACNLRCLNCDRSLRQAPEPLHVEVDRVREFVDASIARGKRWRAIRVLGGEPTLHPRLDAILEELARYRAWSPAVIVDLVTNGHGPAVAARLARLPPWVRVENSAKESDVHPAFRPFNGAPVDDPAFSRADFTNACAIARDCGMGLTPLGYYPCAPAGGIDRITGDGLGRADLPEDSDDMAEPLARLCRLCGHFRDGHFLPRNLRPPLVEESISPSWERLYARWRGGRGAAGRRAPPSPAPTAPS